MNNNIQTALSTLIAALQGSGLNSKAAAEAVKAGTEALAVVKLEAATTRLREGMDYAGFVLDAWESGNLAETVNVLESWAEVASEFIGVCDVLDEGIRVSEQIVANWERNLTTAIGELDGWRDQAIETLIERQALTSRPTVVIEVSGGNITGISSSMIVDTYIVDYDEGEQNDLLPYVEDQGHARIDLRLSSQERPEFCLEIADLHERESVE